VANDITIIVPIYNEEQVLRENLPYLEEIREHGELIFIDGGSSDRSVEIIKDCGRVIQCAKGRSLQMNFGAKHATRSIYLFLHADNVVLPNALISIQKHIEEGFAGGCLTQRIDKKGPMYRIIEGQGNLRAKVSKVFYGDQGIFVKKDKFWKIGGFPDVPIFEDVLFTKKLRKVGKTVVLSDKIIVSPRRWERNGIIKTTLLYNWIIILFRLGIPLEKIKGLYSDLR
jgi:rSAM/selenodomain-associated transferase 2